MYFHFTNLPIYNYRTKEQNMADYQNIKVGVQDRIAVIAIDHPPANAFDQRTLDELGAAIDDATGNPDVKAIIVTGAGQFAFVAGADIKEIKALEGNQDAIRVHAKGPNALQ